MDTITQGLLGAAAAQAVAGDRPTTRTWLYGALGGIAADADLIFEAMADPMLGLRFHRHFTHSLAFIPVGGLLVALPFVLRRRDSAYRRSVVLATTVGYATHAPLDALTNYGTVLFWPFSELRVALDWVSIVDPIVSIVLAVGVVLAARRALARPARLALLAMAMYLGFGGVQNRRATAAIATMAADRGHVPRRMRAMILVLSNMRWRVFYEHDGRAHVHYVTVPWLGRTRARAGPSYTIVRESSLDPAIVDDPRTIKAFRTFRWFADGWIGWWPGQAGVVGDMRYSYSKAELAPMWGIRLRPGAATEPVELVQAAPTVADVLEAAKPE